MADHEAGAAGFTDGVRALAVASHIAGTAPYNAIGVRSALDLEYETEGTDGTDACWSGGWERAACGECAAGAGPFAVAAYRFLTEPAGTQRAAGPRRVVPGARTAGLVLSELTGATWRRHHSAAFRRAHSREAEVAHHSYFFGGLPRGMHR